jgi:hypothetical protein
MNANEDRGVAGGGAENHPHADVAPRPVSRHSLRDSRGRFVSLNPPSGDEMRRRHRRVHDPCCGYIRNRSRAARLTPNGQLRQQPTYGTLDLSIILDMSQRGVRRLLDRRQLPSFRPPNRVTSRPRERLVSYAALVQFLQRTPKYRHALAKLEGAEQQDHYPPGFRARHAEFLAFTAAHPRYQFLVRYLEDAPRPPR